MSSLKMYNFSPAVRGRVLPEGFSVVKYSGEKDIDAWVEICSDGLVDPATAYERFRRELTELDGPDPVRDTYFIEKDGRKKAVEFSNYFINLVVLITVVLTVLGMLITDIMYVIVDPRGKLK